MVRYEARWSRADRLWFAIGQQHRLWNGNPAGYGRGLLCVGGNFGLLPGALASCTANIKSIVEGTTGFWYKPYNGPKGRLQMGMQYSYLVRTAWVGYGTPPYTTLPGSSTTAPKAIENMWFTSFRYYLP